MMIREKRTKSGPLLEVDFYPIYNDGRRIPTRAPKSKPSTRAQAEYNHRQAVKDAVRYVNANFVSGDLKIDMTYRPEAAPLTRAAALRDWDNYKRRMKTKRASELKRISTLLKKSPTDKALREQKSKLMQPFKYYGTVEQITYKTGKHKGKSNWHFHIIMTGGIDRDVAEDLWDSGARVNADRFNPERFGPEAAAKYMTKGDRGERIILRSRNLNKPKTPPPKDGKITPRGVERMAKLRVDDADYWEKRCPGYKFVRTYCRFNEYNGQWYVSAIMYRTGSSVPIKWEVDDWLD